MTRRMMPKQTPNIATRWSRQSGPGSSPLMYCNAIATVRTAAITTSISSIATVDRGKPAVGRGGAVLAKDGELHARIPLFAGRASCVWIHGIRKPYSGL